MEQALAEAEVEKLRERDEVQRAEIKQNSKGVFIEVLPKDRTAKHEIESTLHNFNVWVEVLEPKS